MDDRPITEFDFSKCQIVENPYKSKWFADPFILEADENHIELLVEEFDSNVRRGRIARIDISLSKNIITDCQIVLDLPTHLSFPAIYRENGKILVAPENSASGAFYIYEYDREKDKLVNQKLLHPEPLTDAIIDQKDGKYRMFATCLPTPNGNCLNEYESDSLMGPYTKKTQFICEGNTARMAGYMIHEKGKTLRPAQDCTHGYGEAVLLFEKENVIKRITPTCIKYSGLHTINTYNGYGIIDLKKYDYYFFVKLLKSLKKLNK